MKVIVEIENDEDMKRAERFLKYLEPSIIRRKESEKMKRVKNFFSFVKKKTVRVEKVIIPNREERHAR